MKKIVIGSEELMNELSKCLFENFDSKYSEYNRYSSFDPNIIRSFLNYLGPAGGIITIAEAMKKFIDFIKSKKVKENIRENVIQKPEQLKDGTISIKRLQPGNILMMSGNGPAKPVVEACDTFPLFIIQRGYILILSLYSHPVFYKPPSITLSNSSSPNHISIPFSVKLVLVVS